VDFDPENPQNERKLFIQLKDHFGERFPHTVSTQVPLEDILNEKHLESFIGQRADLLVSSPDAKAVLLEPGGEEHEESMQQRLDKQRDDAFANIGIRTLRPNNREIGTSGLLSDISDALAQSGIIEYLEVPYLEGPEHLANNYLFLLPSLLTRVQWVLLDFLFRQGYVREPSLRIGVKERDLECIELAIVGLWDRIQRLSDLFECNLSLPEVQLIGERNAKYHNPEHSELGIEVTHVENIQNSECDFILDIAIKCNGLTPSVIHPTAPVVSIRQSFQHNKHTRFAYRSRPKRIEATDDTQRILESFVQDIFRKRSFRPGQFEIIKHVLLQEHTIGLLPTSAGKSLCYQLCALLTPGTTFVIDPVVALMDDQTQTLKEFHGFTKVFALHSNTNVSPNDIPRILAENQIIFISPERLQRPNFRAALNANHAADLFINYAVLDEAHCISMWGHDFRPSYLCMKDNLEKLCRFQGSSPVMVALTGTASQLVLIDLKRELDIHEMDAVIRPKTFDRPELNFDLYHCPANEKWETLIQVLQGLPIRLNVRDLKREAWGLVFSHTPRSIWEFMGRFVAQQPAPMGLNRGQLGNHYIGEALGSVQSVLNAQHQEEVRYGLYTGGLPNNWHLDDKEWAEYKRRTLQAFKRGDIRLLFGNTAVSVGIDNENLNYVVNLAMPQSMESYYQQCGRAGRAEQSSECPLIFSDDNPQGTQAWLNGGERAGTWDDIGSIIFFHENAFPGGNKDFEGTCRVFDQLIRNERTGSTVQVEEYFDPTLTQRQAERTERFITFWMMMGVVNSYEVTGIYHTTVYHAKLNPKIVQFLDADTSQREQQRSNVNQHMLESLHAYLSRYRPVSLQKLSADIAAMKVEGKEDPSHSQRCAKYLIQFIYSQIAYQRRESIRTMVTFCNEEQRDSRTLRARIKAYFDTSEKFSKGLMAMEQRDPAFPPVMVLIDRVDDFNDAETLYWETRRLLDERFRIDWAAASLFAIAYRERGQASLFFQDMFQRFLDGLITEFSEEALQKEFLLSFLISLCRLDSVFDEKITASLVSEILEITFRTHRLKFAQLIEDLPRENDGQSQSKVNIYNLQLQDLINAKYSRIIG
jgi:ATP-dependent DNA helicase RecQ